MSDGIGHLVLSRLVDESVRIGDDVVVTVLEIRGNKVRLGFRAPTETVIHREEIWLEIQEKKANGAAHALDDDPTTRA